MDIQLTTNGASCIDASTTSRPFQEYHNNLKELEKSKKGLKCAQKELQVAEELVTLPTMLSGDT
uniref:Uncharacterized protein n=1 Tax=Amphimedon queenslandica TaxID=400682 RepID=A0A1X7U9K2_AMPQE